MQMVKHTFSQCAYSVSGGTLFKLWTTWDSDLNLCRWLEENSLLLMTADIAVTTQCWKHYSSDLQISII